MAQGHGNSSDVYWLNVNCPGECDSQLRGAEFNNPSLVEEHSNQHIITACLDFILLQYEKSGDGYCAGIAGLAIMLFIN